MLRNPKSGYKLSVRVKQIPDCWSSQRSESVTPVGSNGVTKHVPDLNKATGFGITQAVLRAPLNPVDSPLQQVRIHVGKTKE